MTWKTGLCLIKPLKGRSVQACPFRKFHPVGIRAVRQNHRIIRVDAFEGAKLSHGETVSGKAKGRPLQEGRHPRCRPRARAHPPSIRPSPPGTVQGLLRRAHILSAQRQRNHGTVQIQTSTTPHDQSGTQGTRHSGTGAGHHPNHQAARLRSGVIKNISKWPPEAVAAPHPGRKMSPPCSTSSGSETLLRIRSLPGSIIDTLESSFQKGQLSLLLPSS